jgi:K+-sensing histidine kinase KdpD
VLHFHIPQLSIYPNATLPFGNLTCMGFPVLSRKLLPVVDTAIGTLLCASTALVLGLLFHSSRLEITLPLISLAVVIAVAVRFGVATGVLGSLVSAMLLAYFVYTPQHSLRVVNPDARANLSWLLLGGISLSFLFSPRREVAGKDKHRDTD